MNDSSAPGFRPIDIAALTYAGLEAVLVVLFMRNRPVWLSLFGFYLIAICIVLIFALFQKYGFFKILRLFYPVILAPLFYEALRSQIYLFNPHPFDSQINIFEMALLGRDSSFVLQPYMTIWLNEIMSIFYMSYYIIPFVALFLFLFKRKWDSLERGALGVTVTFYICYIIFLIYPVQGPRHYLENIYYLPLIGPFFTPLAQEIVNSGGLLGGAMPSSHCAVTLVYVYYICKESKILRAPAVLNLIMLCISTVYGRYHYIADVFAGLLIGAIAIVLTSRWQDSFLKLKEKGVARVKVEREETVGIGA